MERKDIKRRRSLTGEGVADIVHWLKDALESTGMSQSELARALGYQRDVINKVVKGRRQLTAEEIIKIAAILKVSLPADSVAVSKEDGVSATFRTAAPIRCVGEVQGGVWQEMGIQDFEEFEIAYAPDPRWPEGAVTALRVKGESINRQARDGDFVAVLDVWAAPRELADGDWVVVHRRRGALLEATVKQARRVGDAWELWPSSTDPRFQEPITLDGDGMGEDDEVRVVGFVLNFIRAATPF